jgi:hypothetical protein
VEFYGKLVGMIDINSVELVVTNPVAIYFYNIERLPPDVKENVKRITDPLIDMMEQHDKRLKLNNLKIESNNSNNNNNNNNSNNNDEDDDDNFKHAENFDKNPIEC